MTDANDCTKQALQEPVQMGNGEAQAVRVDREVRPGLAAQEMKISVQSARPSWRVVSTALIPVLSLWLTQAKFIAARCSWTGSITTVPWETGKTGDRDHQCSSEPEIISNLAHTSKGHLNPQKS